VVVRDKEGKRGDSAGAESAPDVLKELEKAKQQAESYKQELEKMKARMDALEKAAAFSQKKADDGGGHDEGGKGKRTRLNAA